MGNPEELTTHGTQMKKINTCVGHHYVQTSTKCNLHIRETVYRLYGPCHFPRVIYTEGLA
jgi:hypothetical protein